VKLPESLTVWRLVAVRHAERAFDLPPGFEVDEIRAGALPPDWRSYPAPEVLKDLGTTWAHSRRTPVLQIPSVVVPVEPNYLLNPDHPEMSRITVRQPLPFSFDRRMWKSG
jgi:RES domain-containing protein